MNRQIIKKGGKPAFVVIPIDEWRRIEAALEDRADTAAVRAFLKNPAETFPDAVVAAILEGTHPVKAMREHRWHQLRLHLANRARQEALRPQAPRQARQSLGCRLRSAGARQRLSAQA
jgi:hypothetical protein